MFKKAALTLGLVVAAPLLISAKSLPVYPLPETIAPDPAAKLGAIITAKPGDVLLTGRILTTEQVTVDAPVKVQIDRFTDEIDKGEELTPVLAPERTRTVIGGDHLYCGRDQRGRQGFAAIWGIGSKFEPIIRLCFIDSDGDKKLDKVFLAGAKDPAMQAPVAIAPTPFHINNFVQRDDGDMVRLRYRKFVPEKMKVELELEVYHKGRKEPFDYLLWSDARTQGLQQQYPRLQTNPKKVPYPSYFNRVLGASIKMDNVRPDGTVDFSIARNFGPALFRPVVIQVTYIYIYI